MLQQSIILFFLILPFQWALSPAPGIDLALIRVLSLGIFLLWGSSSLMKKRFIVPDILASFYASGFLFIAALSILWAENADFSMRKIVFLFSFYPLFFVLISFFKEKKESINKTLSFFIYGGAGMAIIAISQFGFQFLFGVEKVFFFWTRQVLPFFLGSTFGQSVAAYPSLLVNISGKTLFRAVGFLPDPHMFSFYMGILAMLSLGMFFVEKEKKWGYLFMLFCAADLLAFSRGGYLGLGAGLFVFFSALTFRKGINLRALLMGVSVGVCIFLIALGPVGTRFASTFSSEDGSNKERLRLWQEAAQHVSERPFLGVGLGNYPLLVKPSAEYREPIYAHNLFLDISLEIGLIGLSFFLALLILAESRLWKIWKKRNETLALGIFSALLVFATHSLFDTPLFSVQVLPSFLLLLAAGVSWKI